MTSLYPGSQKSLAEARKKRSKAVDPPKSDGNPAWAAHPKFVYVNGITVEVFTRGALAEALNRKVVSIRAMEDKGIIRTPALKGNNGRWYYTRDQIEDLQRLATEEGVIDPKLRTPFSQRFINDAWKILSRQPT